MKSVLKSLSSSRLFSLRDMVWQYAANFGVAIFGALYIFAVGRFLGPEKFGVYAVAAAVPSVVNAIFDYRIQEVSIVVLKGQTDPEETNRDIRNLFLFDVLARLVAFLVSIICGILVLRAFGMATDIGLPIFAAAAVFLAKAGNGMALGVLRLSGNIRKYATLQSLDWIGRLLTLAFLYYADAIDIGPAFALQTIPALIFNVLTVHAAIVLCRSLYSYRFETSGLFSGSIAFFRQRKALLLSSQAISAVDSVVKELDTIICGMFLSVQSVAIYKMAKNFASVAWKLVDPIFVIILPRISDYFVEDRVEDLSQVLRKSTLYLFLASAVVFLLSWGMAFPITHILLGPAYSEVPLVFPLISIWIVAALPFIWTHSVAIASGNASMQAIAGALGNLIGLGAITFGAASAGLYGAAVGLSVAYAAPFLIACLLLVRKKVIQW